MNSLLARQLRKAAIPQADGGLDLEQLLQWVSDHYDAAERERVGANRALRELGERLRERHRVEQASPEARALLDNVAEALLAVRPCGEILFCNAQARGLFAAAGVDLQSLPLVKLFEFPAATAIELALEHWAGASATPGAVTEAFATTLDGRRFPAAIRARRALIAGQRGYMLSVRDVTRRRRREAQLELDARFERLISEICTCFAIAPADSCEAAVGDALRLICEFTGAASARLYRFSTDAADRSDLAECTHDNAMHEATHPVARERILVDTELPWLAGHIRQLRGIGLTSVDVLPAEAEREREWFAASGARSFILTPLRGGMTPLGFVVVQFEAGDPDVAHDLSERLQLLADLFVAELRRAGAAAHEERLMRVLDTTADLVALSDRSGELMFVNSSGRALIGLDPEAPLSGHRLADFLVPGDAARFTATGLPAAVSEGTWRETVAVARGESVTPLAQVTMAHRGDDGSVEFFSTTARDVSGEQAVTQRLADSEDRLRLALGAADMLGWDWQVAAGRLFWVGASDRAQSWFGHPAPPASLDQFLERVLEQDRPAVERAVARAFAGPDGEFRSEHRIACADGSPRWVDMRGSVSRDAHGRAERMTGTLSDISEHQHATLALAEERERALITLQSIADGVVTTDRHGLVESLNPVAVQRLGVSAADMSGRLIDELFAPVAEGAEREHPVLQCLREGRTIESGDGALVRGPAGEQFAIRFSAAPICCAGGGVRGAVVVFQDVNQERSLYQRLSYQAQHDALTGLVNRRQLEDELSERLREAWREEGSEHSLLYLDVDQFKVINDTCSHAAGDQLLRRIAELIRGQVRAGDCLARIGGDEFCVLLAHCGAARAEEIAETLRSAIAGLRFVWQDRTYSVSVSIGLVVIDAGSESIANVLSAADVACHAAKDAGRNRVSAYCAGATMSQHRQMQWVSRITQACEDDRLTLHYHPIVPSANTGERRHFEMLLRMRDPYGTLVPPNSFIPAAERYNLMPLIDRWVVRKVLADYVQADGRDLRYTLAVNLSGGSLSDPHFLDFLRHELSGRDLCPGALCFEITETAAISNLDQVVRFMEEIRGLGCRFALDDFGSGLSSFAYLKDLPVDYLKIDRLFVRNIADDIVDHSMVAAINQVGQVMGLKTVAEGVESHSVLEKVNDAGIDYAQGFLFGRPAEVTNASIFEPRESARIIPLAG